MEAGDTGRKVRTWEWRARMEAGGGGGGGRGQGGGRRGLGPSSEMGPGTGPRKASSAFSVSNTSDKCLHSSARK